MAKWVIQFTEEVYYRMVVEADSAEEANSKATDEIRDTWEENEWEEVGSDIHLVGVYKEGDE